MGDVLLAERLDSNGSSEKVALKRLAPELQDEPYVSMFVSEAKVMSRLDHQNVVHLLDTPLVDGAQCIALELVEGANLYQIMRRAHQLHDPLPVDVVVYIGLEVLAGLAYAHAARVDGSPIHLVHRDVKPGNVLLSRDGDVKLTDFGISKSDLSIGTTSRGVVKGTPHYLSPEQVKGDRATARSDLFSLANVMVEAITGIGLFKRDTLASTLLAVSTGERAEIESLFARRHRALARVLERALATAPAMRFESAEAMASAIAGACPIDEEQARRELARLVSEACGVKKPPAPADAPTQPIRPPPPPEVVERRVPEQRIRSLHFLLGLLMGALAMNGFQIAMRLISTWTW
jgi:eukaryotic-like serine/threonine-protein kinase